MEEVHNLIARYCAAVVDFDRAQFESCWHPDARWIAKGVAVEGIERIAKVFVRARAQFALCVQAPLSTVIEQRVGDGEGRTVHARTQVHETQWLAARAVGVELYGIYDDVIACVAGEWRFAQRSFRELYRGRRPLPGSLAGSLASPSTG